MKTKFARSSIIKQPAKFVKHFILFILGLILVLACSILQKTAFWDKPAFSESIPPAQLIQQGINLYQAGKYPEAIPILQQALEQTKNPQERAVVLSNLGAAYQQVGKLDKAIAHWELASQYYKSRTDNDSRRLQAQLLAQLAQAYSKLGQNQRAAELLESNKELIRKQPDPSVELIALGALGNAYRALGEYALALTAHQDSLKIARKLNNPNYITTALNNLGNVYISRAGRYEYQFQAALSENETKEASRLNSLARADSAAALDAYEQSLRESQKLGGIAEVRALLRLNKILENLPSQQQERIANNRNRVIELLEALPDSRDKAYALIKVAQSIKSPDSRVGLLEKALEVARKVDDSRAQSFALGRLGEVYELANQYSQAIKLTREAQIVADRSNSADSLYLWQWQVGRILKETGEKQQSIAAYSQALATLNSIRGDIVAANKELQFNFRDSVEPVYRELIDLLLEPGASSGNIQLALNTLDSLKLAELQNYFGDECVQIAGGTSTLSNVELSETKAAFITSAILSDRTVIILQAPNKLNLYTVKVGEGELQQEVDKLRYALEDQTTEAYLAQSEKIYDILIRPLQNDLAAIQPSTVVFIQDGVLRKVPMSALYDGEKFLIEKYPIATTPSLSLTNYNLQKRDKLQALAIGLSVARPPFPPLPNVKDEVTDVQKIMGGTTLVDEDFTVRNVEEKIKKQNYPVVHMATHGKFGVDGESTFLQAFNSRISIDELDKILRDRPSQQPVELLTLSACQTAAGNNRSALGIAGMAVRVGVKSVLASLWYINDKVTVDLVKEFYQQLQQPNITKAEALRQAQLKLIAEGDFHPALWSPFILIGNWQ